MESPNSGEASPTSQSPDHAQHVPTPTLSVAEDRTSPAEVGISAKQSSKAKRPAANAAPEDEKIDWDAPLRDDQEKIITSKLIDPKITFDGKAESSRAEHPILPSSFYRTFYETSATLSLFVTIDTHVKHRGKPKLYLKTGNAFQPIADFDIFDFLTKEAIERHLVWNQKTIPSAFISVFNTIHHAIRRAGFHDKESKRIGERVSIAAIKTAGLIPATVHARCHTNIKLITKRKLLLHKIQQIDIFRDVAIPVWIRSTAKDQFGPTITAAQWKASGADMWISITELRTSNLKEAASATGLKRDGICAKGHNYEWLSCGSIAESLIAAVMPWDGKTLHYEDPGHPVRSFGKSGLVWVYNWAQKMWLPDHFKNYFTALSGKTGNGKRKANDGQSTGDKDAPSKVLLKKPGVLQLSAIMTTINLSPR